MARDYYIVEGTEFPGTLRGLTAAIKLAREFAQSGPVDVEKHWACGLTTVAYHVDTMPGPVRARPGHYPQDSS